jgi:hypothetical protein
MPLVAVVMLRAEGGCRLTPQKPASGIESQFQSEKALIKPWLSHESRMAISTLDSRSYGEKRRRK